MYPVQVMISYFTTSFTAIMHIGREVTGGDLQDSKGTYIKNRPRNGCVLFHIDIKKDSVGIYCPFWLPPVCHSVWNDRSMTMFV